MTGFVDDSTSALESEFELEEEQQQAPIGVEVVIAVEGVGEVERLFQLVDPFNAQRLRDQRGVNDDTEGGENTSSPDEPETDRRAITPGDSDDE